jgi:tetratricopeptide (TPR) repeat protein
MDPNASRSSILRLLLEKIPFFILTFLSSGLTFYAQQKSEAVASLKILPLGIRMENTLVSYANYIWKMIWPSPLAIVYPFPEKLSIEQVAGATLLLVGISFLVIFLARSRPYLIVGWLWYLGTLVPVIGLVQVGMQAMADRYTYIPFIGLFIMIAKGIPDRLSKWRYRNVVLALSVGLVLSVLMILTRLQVQLWQNSMTLFDHTLRVTANNFLIHHNLGVAMVRQGRHQEAIHHYQEVLRMRPMDSDVHKNLGVALARLGRHEEAISHYKEALRIKPDNGDAHYNLGITLAKEGKNLEAIHHYTEALRIKPGYSDAHNSLGVVLARQGKVEEAIFHYKEALRIKTDFFEAHNNLGVTLARQSKTEEAIFHFSQALRIKPDDAEAHGNLGNSLVEQGRVEEAIDHYKKALRIKSDLAQVRFYLGLAYLKIGNQNAAMEQHQILKTTNPDLANALSQKLFK